LDQVLYVKSLNGPQPKEAWRINLSWNLNF
jgi:hypothetical protein